MRNIERYFLILVLLLLTIFVARSCAPALKRLTGYQTGLQVELDSSTVYLLNQQSWTEYDLAYGANEVRLIAHAMLAPERLDPELTYRYNIRYQLLNDDGKIVADKVYHLVSKVAPFIQNEHGQLEYSRFYARSQLRPSLDQLFYLRLADYGEVKTLRLQVAPSADQVDRVGVRLAVLEDIDPVDAVQSWRRMLREQRDFLLRNHIFLPHSVSTQEISHLLQRQWLPIGPAGLADEDYDVDTLYMAKLDELDIDGSDDVLASPGAYSDPSHWASLVIEPENKGQWQLQFYPEALEGNTVRLRWQSAVSLEVTEWEVQGNEWTGRLEPGLLEIIPSQPMTFEAESLATRYKPERNYASSYLVAPGEELRFQLSPQGGGRAQVLRLDYRVIAPADELSDAMPADVELAIFSADDRQLMRRTERLAFVHDTYWQLASGPAESKIGESFSHFVQLPANAAYAKVVASQPVLVSMFSRPEDLQLQRNMPLDRRYWFEREQRMPQWFTLYPNNEAELLAAGRLQTLVWHYPILEEDEFIAEDNYERYDFVAKPSIGKKGDTEPLYPLPLLFLDPKTELPRREAIMSRYCRVSPQSGEFSLAGGYLENVLSPQLAYTGRMAKLPVRIDTDGKTMGTRYLGRSGLLSLEEMSLGRHRLALIDANTGTAASGKWWINGQGQNLGCDYAFREVYPLMRDLEFEIDARHFNDNLAIQFFAPERRDVSLRFQLIAHKATGVATAYTLSDVIYNIKGSALSEAYLLDGSGRRVFGPERLNFNVGDDLAGDTISLKVTSSAPGAYVAVARLMPSERERSKVISRLYQQDQE